MKTCIKCNKEKELTEFYSDVSKAKGKSNRCIECDKAHKKAKMSAANHSPDLSLTHKICRKCKENKTIDNYYVCIKFVDGYDKNCKECRCNKEKERYLENAEEIKERNLDYYYNNKPKRREWVRKRQKERMETEPMFVMKRRLRNRLWYALKNKGWKKNSKLGDYIGCDYETLVKHLEAQFKDGMSWERQAEIHVDHIIPLDSAKTEEELLKLCHYTNLQPLWGRENIKKGSKI